MNPHAIPSTIHIGDRVHLTWLDQRGEPAHTDWFTITTNFDPDQDRQLPIHSPVGDHLADAGLGDIVTFVQAGVLVTIRDDARHPAGAHHD